MSGETTYKSVCLFPLNVKKNQQKVNVNLIKIQQNRYFK
ncbi:hypothetical protein BG09_5039 [Bacillus thuringiensis serovar kurstaki str. HD-1]|nr:hypothetical protein BG09_5039 [Bacillus thuringiensis serovar kurstaki str. HD-1]